MPASMLAHLSGFMCTCPSRVTAAMPRTAYIQTLALLVHHHGLMQCSATPADFLMGLFYERCRRRCCGQRNGSAPLLSSTTLWGQGFSVEGLPNGPTPFTEGRSSRSFRPPDSAREMSNIADLCGVFISWPMLANNRA